MIGLSNPRDSRPALAISPTLQNPGQQKSTKPFSDVNGVTFGALCLVLAWIFGEIVYSLFGTQKFKPLAVLFLLAALPISISTLISRLRPGALDENRTQPLWVQGITTLLFLIVATSVLAVWTARTLAPNYEFLTPVLRITASVIDHLF